MITLGKLTAALFAIVAFANLSSAQVLTQTTAPSEGWTSIAASINGSRLVAVSYQGGVYLSKNNGLTWKPAVVPAAEWEAAACSGDGLEIAICSSYGLIYLSRDGGDHWAMSMSVPEEFLVSATMSVDGRKIAVVNFYDSLVYRSTNGGASWQSNSIANLDNYQNFEHPRCIAGSSDGTRLMAVSIAGTIFSSTDSGINWLQTSAPTGNWSSVTMSHDGNQVVASDALGGGIYISDNFGKSWEKAVAPSNNWYAVSSSWNGNALVAGAGGNNPGSGPVYTSVDYGRTWNKLWEPAKGWYAAVMTSDGTDFYAAVLGGSIYQGHPAKNR